MNIAGGTSGKAIGKDIGIAAASALSAKLPTGVAKIWNAVKEASINQVDAVSIKVLIWRKEEDKSERWFDNNLEKFRQFIFLRSYPALWAS